MSTDNPVTYTTIQDNLKRLNQKLSQAVSHAKTQQLEIRKLSHENQTYRKKIQMVATSVDQLIQNFERYEGR